MDLEQISSVLAQYWWLAGFILFRSLIAGVVIGFLVGTSLAANYSAELEAILGQAVSAM